MPRCFKKGNAANCSLTELLAASRRNGIVRREKYSARPAALTTTFTTLGLSYSSSCLMRVAAVDISARSSAAATASMTAGSMRGSSPWILTTASHSQRQATSAIRSEPLGGLRAAIFKGAPGGLHERKGAVGNGTLLQTGGSVPFKA